MVLTTEELNPDYYYAVRAYIRRETNAEPNDDEFELFQGSDGVIVIRKWENRTVAKPSVSTLKGLAKGLVTAEKKRSRSREKANQIDALISLLIKKNVFTQLEFENEF